MQRLREHLVPSVPSRLPDAVTAQYTLEVVIVHSLLHTVVIFLFFKSTCNIIIVPGIFAVLRKAK